MGDTARLNNVGMWVAVGFAAVLAFVVEWMAWTVAAGEPGRRDWLVLALFVAPLLISLGAVSMIVWRRSTGVRLAAAGATLLLPPVLLLGALYG